MTQAAFDFLVLIAVLGLCVLGFGTMRQAPDGVRRRPTVWSIVWTAFVTLVLVWDLFLEIGTSRGQRPVSDSASTGIIIAVVLTLGLVGYTTYRAIKTRAHRPQG